MSHIGVFKANNSISNSSVIRTRSLFYNLYSVPRSGNIEAFTDYSIPVDLGKTHTKIVEERLMEW